MIPKGDPKSFYETSAAGKPFGITWGSILIIFIRPEEQIIVKKVKIGEHEHAEEHTRVQEVDTKF